MALAVEPMFVAVIVDSPNERQRNEFGIPATASATLGLDDAKVVPVTSTTIDPKRVVAENGTMVPTGTMGLLGVSSSEERTSPPTVMIAGPDVTDPIRAVIIAVPSVVPAVTPPPLGVPITDATAGLLLVHVSPRASLMG